MRDGDKIVSMIPAAGYLGESNDGDEATYNVGCDRGRAGSAPSRRNRSQWRGWDGSPCGYRDNFVAFVYREERERRR